MATRREARERALALCYELETKGETPDGLLAELPVPPDEYTVTLVRGVGDHRAELDDLLRAFSERWAVERMPAVDRALLRIGSYELGWQPDLPVGVVIDEAVELAHQYSTRDSGRFVHALLARIADRVRS
jgi:transcription antitermination protein NusB